MRIERKQMLEALLAYLRREIRAFEFDDRIERAAEAADDSVYELFTLLWRSYDDYTDHEVHDDPEVWELYRRAVAWLQTDLEWQHEQRRFLGFRNKRFAYRGCEPFNTWEDWWAHSHLAEPIRDLQRASQTRASDRT